MIAGIGGPLSKNKCSGLRARADCYVMRFSPDSFCLCKITLVVESSCLRMTVGLD